MEADDGMSSTRGAHELTSLPDYRALVTVACGAETKPGGDATLAAAIEAGRAVLARYLHLGAAFVLPVAVATVAAAIVLRGVVATNLHTACAAWRPKAAEA